MSDDQDACRSCRYFRLAEGAVTMGSCRISPPTEKGWPLTTADDWCGDYANGGVSSRLDRVEVRLDRIEQRLGLVEAG